MKIVIIGGTGLIGTKLASKLRQKGHDVSPAAPSANASDTKPARLLAVFVLDSNEENLTIPDHQH